MVNKLMKFFAYFLFFCFALMLFIPKDGLYFLLEKNLKEYGVVISGEQLYPTLSTLKVEHLAVSVKAIDAAAIESVEIRLFGVYNHISVEKIRLSSLVSSYIPPEIDSLDISYTLLNPLLIDAKSSGKFGEAKIVIDIKERLLNVMLSPSKLMQKKYKNSLRYFKKSKDGGYVYTKNF